MNKQTRLGAFLLGCIPTRIAFAVIPLHIYESWLPYYGMIICAISIGFLYLYFGNLRLNSFESGGNTWWSEYRLIHGLLYLTAAIYLFQKKRQAYLPLTLDVVFGFALFLRHHLQL
jgi:hypothetical protein